LTTTAARPKSRLGSGIRASRNTVRSRRTGGWRITGYVRSIRSFVFFRSWVTKGQYEKINWRIGDTQNGLTLGLEYDERRPNPSKNQERAKTIYDVVTCQAVAMFLTPAPWKRGLAFGYSDGQEPTRDRDIVCPRFAPPSHPYGHFHVGNSRMVLP